MCVPIVYMLYSKLASAECVYVCFDWTCAAIIPVVHPQGEYPTFYGCPATTGRLEEVGTAVVPIPKYGTKTIPS